MVKPVDRAKPGSGDACDLEVREAPGKCGGGVCRPWIDVDRVASGKPSAHHKLAQGVGVRPTLETREVAIERIGHDPPGGQVSACPVRRAKALPVSPAIEVVVPIQEGV